MRLLLLICAVQFVTSPLYAQKRISGFDISNAIVKPKEIERGGPAKDGIPALTNPKFVNIKSAKKMFGKKERALVVSYEGEHKAYPIGILNWHEIVNDRIRNKPFTVTYCPLCGTGIVFDAKMFGKRQLFGVSGLLYKSDVLLYDKETESLWSQILRKAVTGKRKGSKLTIYPSKMVNLHTWLKTHKNAKVLSTKTGHSRKYDVNPYSGYESNSQIIFPFKKLDRSEGTKTWTLYVEKNKKNYLIPFSRLKNKTSPINIKGLGKITFNLKDRRIDCPSGSTCLQGYWFALKGFYPKAKIVPKK